MDNLDFLDGQAPAEPTAAVQPAEPAVSDAPAEPTEGPARGPDGKFVSKQADPAPEAVTPEPQAPASPPEAAQPQPTPADDRLAQMEAQIQGLNRALAEARQKNRQPPEPAPDPFEDFEAYQAWQQGQVAQERAEWSRQLAEVKYGAETVSKAQEWAAQRFDADPIFAQQTLASRDPFGFAIEQYQRDQALGLLSDPATREKFMAFLNGQAAPAAAPVAALAETPTPPRSLASAPSAGGIKPGEQPVGPGVAFDSLFEG